MPSVSRTWYAIQLVSLFVEPVVSRSKCMCAKDCGHKCNVGGIVGIATLFLAVAIAIILSTAVGNASSAAGAPFQVRVSSCAVLSHCLETRSSPLPRHEIELSANRKGISLSSSASLPTISTDVAKDLTVKLSMIDGNAAVLTGAAKIGRSRRAQEEWR